MSARQTKKPVVKQADDHEIIIPPTDLKAYATVVPGVDGLDEEALARAEAALDDLKDNFADWMRQEIEVLVAAHGVLNGKPPAKARAWDPLYRAAHDIRGQAATFGYPLAGRIADNLCNYMDQVGVENLSMSLIDAHVDAIVAIERNTIVDDNDPVSRAVLEELSEARQRLAVSSPAKGPDADEARQA